MNYKYPAILYSWLFCTVKKPVCLTGRRHALRFSFRFAGRHIKNEQRHSKIKQLDDKQLIRHSNMCGVAYWSFVLKFKAVQQYSSIEHILIHTCLLSNIGQR